MNGAPPTDRPDDLSIEEAAVELGMSPTALIRLLETGQLPSHLGADGRRRRVLRADVEEHREQRFALRQQLVQEQRARRWVETTGAVVPPVVEAVVAPGDGPAVEAVSPVDGPAARPPAGTR